MLQIPESSGAPYEAESYSNAASAASSSSSSFGAENIVDTYVAPIVDAVQTDFSSYQRESTSEKRSSASSSEFVNVGF